MDVTTPPKKTTFAFGEHVTLRHLVPNPETQDIDAEYSYIRA